MQDYNKLFKMSEESLHRINQILYLSGGASENLKLEGKDKKLHLNGLLLHFSSIPILSSAIYLANYDCIGQ